MRKFIFALVIIVVVAPGAGAIPQLLNFQGRITESRGSDNDRHGDVDDGRNTRDMTFRIFNAPTGGAPVFVEAHTGSNAVAVNKGVFNLLIGGLTPGGIPVGVFDGGDKFIEVQVDATTLPRQRITSVGYSFMSAQAQSLTSGASLQLSALSVSSFTTTNIFTSSIVATNVNSSMGRFSDELVVGSSSIYFTRTGAGLGNAMTFTPSGGLIPQIRTANTGSQASPTPTGALNLIINAGAGGELDLNPFSIGSVIMSTQPASKVGIGTAKPSTLLDVEGEAQFGSGVTKSTFSSTGRLTFPSGYSPAASLEAATKGYVDSQFAGGAAWTRKAPVVTLTNPTDNVVIQSTLTVQGNAFSVGFSTLVVTGGNIGIGTTNPNQSLHIFHGAVRVDPASNGNPQFIVGDATQPNNPLGAGLFQTDSSAATIIGNSGLSSYIRFPINAMEFHVNGPVRFAGGFLISDSGGTPPTGSGVNNIIIDTPNLYGTTDRLFQVRNSGAIQFLVNGAGNVGIGTASPNFKMDVQGGQINVGDPNGYFQLGSRVLVSSYTNQVTFVGYGAGSSNASGTGNSFMGFSAGNNNTTGSLNSIIGAYAGLMNNTGAQNTLLGYAAGRQNTSGVNNTFVGFQAGFTTTDGGNNTFIGSSAGEHNSGTNNTAMGIRALSVGPTTGGGNIALGAEAGMSDASGDFNLFAGYQAGRSNTGGGSNIFLGSQAGYSNTTGATNIFIGPTAGYNNTTGAGNVFIGPSAGYNNTTANNQLIIANNAATPLISGDFSTGNVGVGTTSPNARFQVASGDIHTSGAGTGIIVKSPSGLICKRIGIDDTGAIVASVVLCP